MGRENGPLLPLTSVLPLSGRGTIAFMSFSFTEHAVPIKSQFLRDLCSDTCFLCELAHLFL